MVLSVDQATVTRLDKEPLRMFISTMPFRSEGHTRGVLGLDGTILVGL